jgi:hypothetical protein
MSILALSNSSTIDSLLVGTRWGSNTSNTPVALSFSFPEGVDTTWKTDYLLNEPSGWSALSSSEQNYFRQALSLWSEVANINLTEVTDNQTSQGDIRATFSTIVTNSTTAAAWAYVPTDFGVLDESGDVWLSKDIIDFQPESFGFTTLLHEIGHALGLKHPFATQGDNSAVLASIYNSSQYTLMSYTDYEGAGSIYTPIGGGRYSIRDVQATTPMLYDIQAIQYIYGANTQSHIGNDIYTFNNNHGELKTIWDAGGIDTFDLSNQSLDMIINLNEGAFSSLGVKQTSISDPLSTADNNIAIAFNTVIENAIGGRGNDTFTGNNSNNIFTGGLGNDALDGGAGIDTALYSGNRSQYKITTLDSTTLQINSLSNNEGIDTLVNIEKLKFQDQVIETSLYLASTITEKTPTHSSEVITQPIESDNNYIHYFLLELSSALQNTATVQYQTQNGTAIAGQDYIATSGTASIIAGQTHVAIAVEILADNITESNETFSLIISNPQGGIFPTGINQIIATHTIIDDDLAAKSAELIGIEPLSSYEINNID